MKQKYSNHSEVKRHTQRVKIHYDPRAIKNDDIQCEPKRVPKVRPGWPSLHRLVGLVGHVGAGKTVTAVNFIKQNLDYGSFTKVYIISPTYDSNASLQTLPVDPDCVYTDVMGGPQALNAVENDVLKLVNEYENEKEYKKAYKAWTHINRLGMHLDRTTPEQKVLLQNEKYRPPREIPWPSPVLFIDDMAHTTLMSDSKSNPLSQLASRHRHLHGVGITIIIAIQSFRSGIPRFIRGNLTLTMLYNTIDMEEIDDLHAELANGVTKKTFKECLYIAFKSKHAFLMVDKKAEDPNKLFSRNFNEPLEIDLDAEIKEVLGITTDNVASSVNDKL